MTSSTQPKQALSISELVNLVAKPKQPSKPAKGFLMDVPHPQKTQQQMKAPSMVSQQPVQTTLKESYERVQQELYQVYKQAKWQVPKTAVDQMSFVQSYKDVLSLLEATYSRGTGQLLPQSEAGWQKCYTETIAMLETFYRKAQQSPEALAQVKRLFFLFYTQVRRNQPRLVAPHIPLGSSPVPLQAQTPPAINPKHLPIAAKPAQPTVAQPVQPIVVDQAQAAVQPKSALLDLANCRRWTPQELQRFQQGIQAPQAKPPSSIAQPRVAPSPVNSQPMPHIPPSQPHTQASMLPASNAQVNDVWKDNFRSPQPQSQRDRQPWDPRVSRREFLLRERLVLERGLQRDLSNANAVNERWQLWHAHKAQLDRDKAFVPVKEMFSFVARRLVRIPLPSAARQISFREARLNQEATWLQQQAIAINTRYNALLQEIQVIDTELGMLHF